MAAREEDTPRERQPITDMNDAQEQFLGLIGPEGEGLAKMEGLVTDDELDQIESEMERAAGEAAEDTQEAPAPDEVEGVAADDAESAVAEAEGDTEPETGEHAEESAPESDETRAAPSYEMPEILEVRESEDGPEFGVVVEDGEFQTLADLRDSYFRSQDYHSKTHELKQERQALREKQREVLEHADQYARLLPQLAQAIKSQYPLDRDEAEWQRLKQQDPARYTEERAAYLDAKEKVEQIKAEQQRVLEEQQNLQRQQLEETIAAERDKLVAAIPEWADPSFRAQVAKFAEDTYDVAPQELGAVHDHRVFLMLQDAMKYRQAKGQGEQATAGAKKRPAPTLKPGRPETRQEKQRKRLKGLDTARERLRQTGDPHDFERVLQEMNKHRDLSEVF